MNQIIYAPILIATCNRIDHLKRTINALQCAEGASNTPLYISIDGPYSESVRIANDEVKKFINNVEGFLYVKVFEREKNIGTYNNFMVSTRMIFKKYSRIIYLEDDCLVSNNFIKYLNRALDFYENDFSCYAVCGYNYPTYSEEDLNSTDVYKSQYFSGWGVGFFRDRYIEPKFLLIKWGHLYRNPLKFYRAERLGGLISSLMLMKYKKEIWGDVCNTHHLLQKNMYCIFPTKTKVINIGNDGSGVNCIKDEKFEMQNFLEEKSRDLILKSNNATDIIYRKKNRFYFGSNSPLVIIYTYFIYLIIGRFEGAIYDRLYNLLLSPVRAAFVLKKISLLMVNYFKILK
ncbi:glycosyltransferase [Polynucleobacter sp. Latsch14-2]|uniref:glycosyltransferase n=1 Tax=Polynucleobacter sp. Latsch14-2 TaxID=2576920 RepID=UPI001C0B083C|nr:glycosyltransferase [Polynucleobacter sp. Latsch14-2]MBU3615521.1 glycosyltransferase [Polynucleobacter sp. Latsch14-2]